MSDNATEAETNLTPAPGMTEYEEQTMRKEYLTRALEQRGEKSVSEVVEEVRTLVDFVLNG